MRRMLYSIAALFLFTAVLYISMPAVHLQANAPEFSLATVPPNGATLSERRPLLKWTLFPNGNAVSEYAMLLDGQEVPAQLLTQGDTVLLAYRPLAELAPGAHTLVCTVRFKGYQPSSITARFVIAEHRPNPYAGKDYAALLAMERDAVAALNRFRQALGIEALEINHALSKSAQAHSNYLSLNRVSGHYEREGDAGFTGVSPQDRAGLFGYDGQTGEGVDFGLPQAGLGIDALMDAPYHRLGHINPNYRDVGIGFSLEPHNTVVNYGLSGSAVNATVMLYPYPGQPDAKVSWFAAETPNPLAYYGLDRVYVGYPISMSLHDSKTAELRVISAALSSGGEEVPFYLVDSTKETEGKTHIFMIPHKPLLPGRNYTVEIKAARILKDGAVEPIHRQWSFHTGGELSVRQAGIIRTGSADNIEIRLKNGNLPDMEYILSKGGKIARKYKTGRGYSWSGQTNLESGVYQLEVTSGLFATGAEYTLEISGEGGARKVLITGEKKLPPEQDGEMPRPGIITISGREHIELIWKGNAPAVTQYTLSQNGMLLRRFVTAEQSYYYYRQPLLGSGEYLLEITASQQRKQIFSLHISGEGDQRKLTLISIVRRPGQG